MNEKKSSSNVFAEWLEKLQQESWQLELIISGFAIYGLFSANDYMNGIDDNVFYSGEWYTVLIMFALIVIRVGIMISTTNLLVHVFIRGLWIGAIGLRYVSGDIDYDKLNYSPRINGFYQKKIGSFDRYIEKLEKLASTIFSYTFLLFFISFSCFIYLMTIFAFVYYFITNNINGFLPKTITIFHSLLGLIIAFDFVTLGLLKRIKQKHFSAIFYWIYRYVGLFTFSFLWRPIALNFLDTKFTKVFFVMIIPYFLIILSLSEFEINQLEFYPIIDRIDRNVSSNDKYIYNNNNYDDEFSDRKDKAWINLISIPSKRVSGSIFEVFVKGLGSDDRLISQQKSNLHKIRKKGLILELSSSDNDEKDLRSASWDSAVDSIGILYKDDKIKGVNAILKLEKDRVNKERRIATNELKEIKDIIQSSFSFKLNETSLNPSKVDCDFYLHPNNGEKGMLCFFPIDSLEVGRNYLSFEKIMVPEEEGDSNYTINYTIPFVYEGK